METLYDLFEELLNLFEELFSKADAPFYIPTNSVWRSQFFHILNNTCYYWSFYYSDPSKSEVLSLCFLFEFP